MIKKLLLFILLCQFGYAQHTERFIALVSELEGTPLDSITLFYKVNTVEWKGPAIQYCYMKKPYETYTGEWTHYDRKGNKISTVVFGLYGNVLTFVTYNKDGWISSESVTYELDTTAKNLTEFFESNGHLLFKRKERTYRYDKALQKRYLYQEGENWNGKKRGVWKTYAADGTVVKEKQYS
ncbi:conserved exported hypothetical protein [Flavobacterium sp. 9AF]|uniref:hypothetical protein n=1 Tax=Flavobacterium sp. 9AF TaxID=2653142 RepID=UPI0012F2E9B8|nr:hypothetical protein [Flavobacterium sp. 9AF]VXB49013.1 conserved exported hypothetical protein [Flavobacterium sp. 9AF]